MNEQTNARTNARIQELSEKLKPLAGDLGKLTTDIKVARAQGNNSPFKSDGLGGVDKQTFDRIKTLIVDGLGVDPSKNALFDQELKVNILKNLDVLSTINELQNQITKAQISAGKDQILAEPFIKQVTDQIRERLNQLSPETRDPRAPEKFVSPASGQLGSNLSRGFVDDFKTGFSDTLKGKITGKEFGTRITDAFTSRVVDSFASRAIDTVFSGDAFANIFGGTGQVGEISGNLFNKLLPQSAIPALEGNKPDSLLSLLSGPTKAPIPVVVVPGTDSVFKSISGGPSSGGLFGGLGDTFGKIKDGFGDFFSKGFSGISSLFSFLPGFASGGVIPGQMGSATPVLAHAGEIILNESQQARVAAAMNNSNQQVINLNITGDISRQTKSEIYRMLPSIAEGVNSHNREKGLR